MSGRVRRDIRRRALLSLHGLIFISCITSIQQRWGWSTRAITITSVGRHRRRHHRRRHHRRRHRCHCGVRGTISAVACSPLSQPQAV